MSQHNESFAQLMLLVRQGDADAFENILQEYGDAIRREVHFTLIDTQLRRFVCDSDVYQSVVMRFFSGMREGQYTIEQPKDLVSLLKGISRTRIAELVRFWHAQRRDLGRCRSLNSKVPAFVQHGTAHPLDAITQSETVVAVDKYLTKTDRNIMRWRDEGLKWIEIAKRLGIENGDTVRKQHDRALARIAAALE